MIEQKLLDCPFCGRAPKLEDHRLCFGIFCKCGVSMIGDMLPEPESEDEITKADVERVEKSVIILWNRRTR